VIAREIEAPLVTGKTPQPERERLYDGSGAASCDVSWLSKVGNFALDLPDADVLIQVSGRIRLPPRGGAAPRPHPAAETGWPRGTLLHLGLGRHLRGGVRPPPEALSHRTGILLPNRDAQSERRRRVRVLRATSREMSDDGCLVGAQAIEVAFDEPALFQQPGQDE